MSTVKSPVPRPDPAVPQTQPPDSLPERESALPVSSTVSLYQEKAAAVLEAIQALVELIPDFEVALKGRRRQIASAAAIPDDALLTVAAGCEASEVLATASLLTTAKVKEVVAFCDAFMPVLRAALVFTRGLKDTMTEKRAEVGQLAFRALRIGRDLKLPPGVNTTNLVRYIDEMEAALKRPRKPRIAREFNKALGDARRDLPKLTVSVAPEPPIDPAAKINRP